jgi:predicted DsbA family dithiol-disulfide isomerase/uncharacterized protein (DUF2267 family)
VRTTNAWMGSLVCAVLLAGCASQRGGAQGLERAAPAAPSNPRHDAAAGDVVVARFASGAINARELEARAAGPLLAPRQRVFEVQSAILEGMIFDRLVAETAAALGLSSDEYLQREVEAGLSPPSEEQVARVLAQFRGQLPADDAQARSQVVAFLSDRERERRLDALKERLFERSRVELFLEPPRFFPPLRPFDPVRGADKPAVTIVEFSDFRCPYCRRAASTLEELLARYPHVLQLVFKQFPGEVHPQARDAAAASLCAAAQGQFWAAHHLLFERQEEFEHSGLPDLVAALGLEAGPFAACLADPATQAAIDADLEDAAALGLDGTPRFLVNGRLVEGAQPLEAFVALVEDELRRSRQQPAGAVSAPRATRP